MTTNKVLNYIDIEITAGYLEEIAELFTNLGWLRGPVQIDEQGNVHVKISETKKVGTRTLTLVETDIVEINTEVVLTLSTKNPSEMVEQINKWSKNYDHYVEIFPKDCYECFFIYGMGAYFKIVDINHQKNTS